MKYLKDDFAQNDFKESLSTIKNFDFLDNDFVLCHNDLNSKNIIIDLKEKILSGIIDFGNSIVNTINTYSIST